jgi:hypothetical protein
MELSLLDRIENILRPTNTERLDLLMLTKEFTAARFRLRCMQGSLCSGEELTDEQIEYLREVEKHQENIYPHIEILTVGGEEKEVFFITKTPEPNGRDPESETDEINP